MWTRWPRRSTSGTGASTTCSGATLRRRTLEGGADGHVHRRPSPTGRTGSRRRARRSSRTRWTSSARSGTELKKKDRPMGQAFGHSLGDPNGWAYAVTWCFGGQEVDKDQKRVMINSKETIEALKFTVAMWKDALDEGGLAWDDSSNNRAYLRRDDLGHAQRLQHLLRRQAAVPGHREGHEPRPHAEAARRPLLPDGWPDPRDHEVLEEPGRGRGVHPLADGPASVRQVLRGRTTAT